MVVHITVVAMQGWPGFVHAVGAGSTPVAADVDLLKQFSFAHTITELVEEHGYMLTRFVRDVATL